MVAPMRVMVPSYTWGRKASCWALLKRCISSTKRMVLVLLNLRRSLASAIILRSSGTPAVTALNFTKTDSVAFAMMRARVVLPYPWGPQNII